MTFWYQDFFEDGKYFTLNGSSPYIGDGDAVLVGMPRLRQLRVKEGIFKKLYQRRPNKNVAGVNYVDETDLMVSCKRSVNIPRSKSQVLSCVKKNSKNQPPKGSSHKRLDYWNERRYRDKPKTSHIG